MADFNFEVNTSPMAHSIDTVNSHVSGVTKAVVIMQTAVVDAQRRAANNICENVDNGFYMLMKSQLSQKIASCSSIMSSKVMLMQKFRDDIYHIQNTMENDYNRICRRYMKVFNSLDEALKNRIAQLDKRTVELGHYQKGLATKLSNETAKIVISDEDIQKTTTKVISATTKVRTGKTLSVLANNVIDTEIYNRSVQSILKNDELADSEKQYVPVIISEADSMFSENTSVNMTYVPSSNVIDAKKDKIVNQINNISDDFSWKNTDEEELKSIRNIFVSKCANDNVEERVAKEMLRLFDEGSWQSLDKQGE